MEQYLQHYLERCPPPVLGPDRIRVSSGENGGYILGRGHGAISTALPREMPTT